jgi:hypothetical protein
MEREVPAGWYPDANGQPCERYWDGGNWTDETRPVSVLSHRAPPQPAQPRTGLDSKERTLLVVIVGIIVLVALFSV